MRRVLAVLAVLALALPALGELNGTEITANDGAQTVTVGGTDLGIFNDSGGNEIYVRVFEPGETVVAAVASAAGGRRIAAGEGMTYHRAGGIAAVSVICSSGETATVRFQYW